MWAKMTILSLFLSATAWAQDADKDEKKKKDDEAKVKIDEFKKGLKTCKTEGDVRVALQKLGELQHPRVLNEFRNYLVSRSLDLVGAATEQVSKYKKEKEAADALIAAVGAHGKNKDAAVLCIRSLGEVGFKPSARVLLGYFKNRDTMLAREAVDSVGKLKSKDSIDPLLNLARELEAIRDDNNQPGAPPIPLPGANVPQAGGNQMDDDRKRKQELKGPVNTALQNVTGEKWGTLKEWEIWWNKNRSKFKELE